MFGRFLFLIGAVVFISDDVQARNSSGQQTGNSASPQVSSIGFSSDPQIVSGGVVSEPALLLKRGLGGTVTLSIDLDNTGKVERSSVAIGTHSILDSIALSSISNLACVPAFENGKAVASSITLQLVFDPDSMVAESSNHPPDIEGIVLDLKSKAPLPFATINMRFDDTLSDPDIAIGFDRYLRIIGSLPNQRYIRGCLSTTADSGGRFSFHLLPYCHARFSVQATGYEVARFSEHPKADTTTVVTYYMERIIHAVDEANTVIVYGDRNSVSGSINVERRQLARGLTHSVGKLLLTESSIRQMPEGSSALLVRAGSPFDNRYLIAGVPFLAPFHFGGYPYGDIDGMMISALSDISVTIDGLAGTYADVSGALIEATPGIYRPANPRLRRRPELAIDFGWLGVDLLLSIPAGSHDNENLQIGCTFPDGYALQWLYGYYHINDHAHLDLGKPESYHNVTLTDTKIVNSLQFDSFGWFAIDSYVDRENKFPWGMGSITAHPVGSDNRSLTIGGSHQYFAKGKRIRDNAFLNTTYLSNGVLDFNNDSIPLALGLAGFGARVEVREWSGTIAQRDILLPPSIVIEEGGMETEVQIRGEFEKKLGSLQACARVLGVGVAYEAVFDVFADGGVSLQWDRGNYQAGLNLEHMTTRPDIRGLPDSAFRQRKLHSYVASLPLHYRTPRGKCGIQPYLRFQDRSPRIDPLLYTWDTGQTTQLFAQGVDIAGELRISRAVALYGVINLSHADRIQSGIHSEYEWDVPWSLRCGAHFSLTKKGMHLYVDNVVSRGIPHFDFTENGYRALPMYNRTDLSFQYRSQEISHRYLTRYDGYFNIRNILDRFNVRDIFWDSKGVRRVVTLSPFYFEMGLRVGLRL